MKENIFATPQDDNINTLVPNAEINFTGDEQNLFTGSGDDAVDVIAAKGNNRIDLGSGDDTVFSGTENFIIGADGNDVFFMYANGGNIILGGAGADQYWLLTDQNEVFDQINTIADFNPTEDVIGFGNADLSFSDLKLTQQGDDVIIQALGQDLAKVMNVKVEQLTADKFVFKGSGQVEPPTEGLDLLGDERANRLEGSDGDDTFTGGLGEDTLILGKGVDTIIYNTLDELGDDIYGFTPGEDIVKVSPEIKSELSLDQINYDNGIITGTLKSNGEKIFLGRLAGAPDINGVKSALGFETKSQSRTANRFFDTVVDTQSASQPEGVTTIVLELTGQNAANNTSNYPEYIRKSALNAYQDGEGNDANKVWLKFDPTSNSVVYQQGNQNWRNLLTRNTNLQVIGVKSSTDVVFLKNLIRDQIFIGGLEPESIQFQGNGLTPDCDSPENPGNFNNKVISGFESNDPAQGGPLGFEIPSLESMPLTWYEGYGTGRVYFIDYNMSSPLYYEKRDVNANGDVPLTTFYQSSVTSKQPGIADYVSLAQKTSTFAGKTLDAYIEFKQSGFAGDESGKKAKSLWEKAGSTKQIKATAKTLGFASSALKITNGFLKLFDDKSSNDLAGVIDVITGGLDGIRNFREATDAVIKATGSNNKYLEGFRKAVANDLKAPATVAFQNNLRVASTAIGAPVKFTQGINSLVKGDTVQGIVSMAGAVNQVFETALKVTGKASKYLKFVGAAGSALAFIELAIAVHKMFKARADYQDRTIDFLNSGLESIYNELAPQLKENGLEDLWVSFGFNGETYNQESWDKRTQLDTYYPKQQWINDHDNKVPSINPVIRILKRLYGIKNGGKIAAESSDYISQFSTGYEGPGKSERGLKNQYFGMNLTELDSKGVPVPIPITKQSSAGVARNMAVYGTDGTYDSVTTGSGDDVISLGSDGFNNDNSATVEDNSSKVQINSGDGKDQIDIGVGRIPEYLNSTNNTPTGIIPRYKAPSINAGADDDSIDFSQVSQGTLFDAPLNRADAEAKIKNDGRNFPVVGMEGSILLDLAKTSYGQNTGMVYIVPVDLVYWSLVQSGSSVIPPGNNADAGNEYFHNIYPNYDPNKIWPVGLEGIGPNSVLKVYEYWKKNVNLSQAIISEQKLEYVNRFTATDNGDDIVTFDDNSTNVDGLDGKDFIVAPTNITLKDGFNDQIFAGAGDDVVITRRKAPNTENNAKIYNKIEGNEGNDTLVGATGQNYIDGGEGNDTLSTNLGDSKNIYVFGRGYGQDTIDFTKLYSYTGWDPTNGFNLNKAYNDQNGDLIPERPLELTTNDAPSKGREDLNQTIYFKDDILANQLKFDSSSGDVKILFSGADNSSDGLLLKSGTKIDSNKTGISTMVFADGLKLKGLNEIAKSDFKSGDDNGNTLSASYSALISGLGGNDTITGSTYGDTLIPGNGSDVINPSAGNDLIVIGQETGTDTIKLTQASGNVTLQFQGDVSLDDLSFQLNNGKVEIKVGRGGNPTVGDQKIVIDSELTYLNKLKPIKFANGLELPISSVISSLFSTTSGSVNPKKDQSESLHFGEYGDDDDYNEKYYVYEDGTLAAPIPVNLLGAWNLGNFIKLAVIPGQGNSSSLDNFPPDVAANLTLATKDQDFKQTGNIVYEAYVRNQWVIDKLPNGTIINDTIPEPPESLLLFVQPQSSNGVELNDTAQLVIIDDDGGSVEANFSGESFTIKEGDGTFVQPVTFTLSAPSTIPVVCNIKIVNPENQFDKSEGSVTFEPGETTKTVNSIPGLLPKDDGVAEEDQQYQMELYTNNKLTDAANLTLQDNDKASESTVGDDSLTSSASLPILSGGFGEDTLVGYAGSDILIGGDGADVLAGTSEGTNAESGSKDTYIIQSKGEMDLIQYRPNATGNVVFADAQAQYNNFKGEDALSPGEIWFKQENQDLLVYFQDVKNGVKIDKWFDANNKIDTFSVVNQVEGYYTITEAKVKTLLGIMSNTSKFEAPWTPTGYYNATSTDTFPQVKELTDAVNSNWILTVGAPI